MEANSCTVAEQKHTFCRICLSFYFFSPPRNSDFSALLLLKSSHSLYSANLAPSNTRDSADILFCMVNIRLQQLQWVDQLVDAKVATNRRGSSREPAGAGSCFLSRSHHEACDWLGDHYPWGARAGHLVAVRGLSRLITSRQPTPLNRFCWQNNVFLCHCAPSCVGICVCACVYTVGKR